MKNEINKIIIKQRNRDLVTTNNKNEGTKKNKKTKQNKKTKIFLIKVKVKIKQQIQIAFKTLILKT